MTATVEARDRHGFSPAQYFIFLKGIVWREALRLIHQHERFSSALALLPARLLCGFMLGALGMLISSLIKQLENFAGVMNFVIFPMFFASSALYPLWRVKESSLLLYYVCELNPFTHATELIRFALYEQVSWVSLGVVLGCTIAFLFAAILAYDPARGFLARRNNPAG